MRLACPKPAFSYGLSLAIAATSIAVAFSASAMADGAPPPETLGVYTGGGCPKLPNQNVACVAAEASDRVVISRKNHGKLYFTAKIVFGHGHTCTIKGPAAWSDSEHGYTVTAEGLDPQKPCRLIARLDGNLLALEDSGGFCREVYCGSRGAFDGLAFRKK